MVILIGEEFFGDADTIDRPSHSAFVSQGDANN